MTVQFLELCLNSLKFLKNSIPSDTNLLNKDKPSYFKLKISSHF